MKSIEDIYKEYNVDVSRLKRDYSKEPIRVVPRCNHGGLMKELPEKEDMQYLYIDLNMQREDLSIITDRSESNLIKVLREMGIKKDPKQIKKNTAKNLMKKEGIINVFQRKQVKDKIKQTNIERYGVESYSQTDEYVIKVKQTSIERYGVDSPVKTKEIQDKIISTNIERYNAKSPTQKLYSDLQKELIYNEDKLLEYIQTNKILNIKDLSKKLNLRYRTLWCIINRNDWYHLFDYNSSIAEREIRDYINQYYQTENNSKKYLDGKEIDIYIPELKLGIEYNGNYWHNEMGKPSTYHQEKSQLAEEKGIFIYHIFEYEWATKREQILNQLNNLLKVNQEKIYARKCDIREVTNEDKTRFLTANHLQGNDASSIKLGLYYQDKLVSLMTFCKPRFNKNYEWELSRFCSLAGYNVIGGASKLFKHFIKMYEPKSIISYSNYAHTRGNLYKTLDFEFKELSSPNYVWINHYDVLSRYQCQKHKLLEQGFTGSSELEIMRNRGYSRIFDCGNKVWIWKNLI